MEPCTVVLPLVSESRISEVFASASRNSPRHVSIPRHLLPTQGERTEQNGRISLRKYVPRCYMDIQEIKTEAGSRTLRRRPDFQKRAMPTLKLLSRRRSPNWSFSRICSDVIDILLPPAP